MTIPSTELINRVDVSMRGMGPNSVADVAAATAALALSNVTSRLGSADFSDFATGYWLGLKVAIALFDENARAQLAQAFEIDPHELDRAEGEGMVARG